MRNVDRTVKDAHKKEMQEKFRYHMGYLVDALKHSLGATTDVNTARAFFWNPVITSLITRIDEILIRKLCVVLTTIVCEHEIHTRKFKEFCLATA
ncbi:hypothetical protein TNIN_236931 [Trichonephila inaurata madagascariensis]|uniref:Uncharacterized protein n=1 Tax=Trichonephila inaurata madagascariensis TaxID=2747483 RepID=A0A8X7CCE3_9ARAC|nr:hypothetical protein TNIN_236931 [Trichonephila inaurata madagascariensis]